MYIRKMFMDSVALNISAIKNLHNYGAINIDNSEAVVLYVV